MSEETQETKIISLFSGSKGNCTYCSIGGYEFLIDAGGSSKRICDSLMAIGSSPERIRDIFITHEHTDHVSALPVFLKKTDATVHMTAIGAIYMTKKHPQLSDRIVQHPVIFEHVREDVCISSFPLSHDSLSCVGYLVREGSAKLFASATDTGRLTREASEALSGCRYVQCESNHDTDMLLYGIYPPYLKERILSSIGHLSNNECASLVSSLLCSGCKRIMLAHLSEENNTPEKAAAEIVKVCGEDAMSKICIASQRCSTVLV